MTLTSGSPCNQSEVSFITTSTGNKQEIKRYNITIFKIDTRIIIDPDILYNPKTLCHSFIDSVNVRYI